MVDFSKTKKKDHQLSLDEQMFQARLNAYTALTPVQQALVNDKVRQLGKYDSYKQMLNAFLENNIFTALAVSLYGRVKGLVERLRKLSKRGQTQEQEGLTRNDIDTLLKSTQPEVLEAMAKYAQGILESQGLRDQGQDRQVNSGPEVSG